MSQIKILDACNCMCHPHHKINKLTRPSMAQLHQLVQNREWSKIKQAIRKDVSVAMRIDDSVDENKWFRSAREAAWRRDTGLPSESNEVADNSCCTLMDESEEVATGQSVEDEALPVRYWVRQNGQSAIRQRRTLLHSISKLKFHSDEALVAQLSAGDCEELHDLVEACLTAKMLIDASVNELKPIEEGGYNEDTNQEIMEECLDEKCLKCSCYYRVRFCPPVGLDPVENYNPRRSLNEGDNQSSDESQEKVLHKSVLSMTDALGATPLHTLTGEGSAHVDLANIFIDGCKASENDRRPSVYELLSAQNGHGCTLLHFLSDSASEEVLRFLLVRLQHENAHNNSPIQNSNATHNQLHPLLIQDNEGDLPLHFACSNGAHTSLLSLLTSDLGQCQSVAVRNLCGRLPIDDLINWYVDSLATDQEDSEDEPESSDEDYDSSTESDHITIKCGDVCQSFGPVETIFHAMKLIFIPSVGSYQLTPHCKQHLWERMLVLISTSAQLLITRNSIESNTSAESECPIHEATIATKYFNLPAIALVVSVLITRDELAQTHGHELDLKYYTMMALSQEDCLGLLPLHLACGKFEHITSERFTNTVYQQSAQANKNLLSIRWNSKSLQCSIVEYLLCLCPESAQFSTRERRLPLHLLLDGGYDDEQEANSEQKWRDIKSLLEAWPEAIRTPDIHTRMYPFQTAAASTSMMLERGNVADKSKNEVEQLKSIEIAYRLILEDPSLCCNVIK